MNELNSWWNKLCIGLQWSFNNKLIVEMFAVTSRNACVELPSMLQILITVLLIHKYLQINTSYCLDSCNVLHVPWFWLSQRLCIVFVDNWIYASSVLTMAFFIPTTYLMVYLCLLDFSSCHLFASLICRTKGMEFSF